jgi:hypothetical protein
VPTGEAKRLGENWWLEPATCEMWSSSRTTDSTITFSNEDRLGALGDLRFAVEAGSEQSLWFGFPTGWPN